MKKNIIAIAAAVILLTILICTLDIQTPEQYYSEKGDEILSDSFTVTMSVDCLVLANNPALLEKTEKQNSTLPENGIIIPETQCIIHRGDTVFNVLTNSLKKNKIQYDYSGGDGLSAVYVKGINNLYEHDFGDLSGWMYSVNGDFPQVSCSDYVLDDGDVICWKYRCDLGREIGDNYYKNKKE